MKRTIIPKQSALHLWVDALSITEVPVSYQVLTGLSALGACLKRNVWVDQEQFKVFPNMSVLLVGPSGIGKDTAIMAAEEIIREVEAVPLLGGRTIEQVKHEMTKLAPPAACFIPAKEVTAFLGGKDYQKSMVQELTDLLSTGKVIDNSIKSDKAKSFIYEPTVTIQGGSTAEWLLRAMPDNSLEGGFLPRFVLILEDHPAKSVAWIKYDTTREERRAARGGKASFIDAVKAFAEKFAAHPREAVPTEGARNYYRNWYENRFGYFSPLVKPYANRSRDHSHRLALLMAVSCGRAYLEECDYQFAADVIDAVATSIDRTLAPLVAAAASARAAYEQPRRGRPRRTT